MTNLLLCGELGTEAIDAVYRALDGTPLHLMLCTPGAELCAWTGIIDLTAELRKRGFLTTVGLGEVVSGGVPILASGSEGRRLAYPHTMFGIHEPYLSGTTDDPAVQNSELRLIGSMKERFYNLLEEFTGKTKRFWRGKIQDKSMVWIDCKEAQKWGLIDGVV